MLHRDLELAHGVEVVVEQRARCVIRHVQVVGIDACHAQRRVRELQREHVSGSYELGDLRVQAGNLTEDLVLVQVEAVASGVRVRNLRGPEIARWEIGCRNCVSWVQMITVCIEEVLIGIHVNGCLVEREFNHGSIRGTYGSGINFIASSRARSGVETNPIVRTSSLISRSSFVVPDFVVVGFADLVEPSITGSEVGVQAFKAKLP